MNGSVILIVEITELFNDSISPVLSVATMFIFAIAFFSIILGVGLFNSLIACIVKLSMGII
ncbi:hypothetical protein ACFOU0_01895 [Salinicoccus sesuvii]|uniref:Uncharacterized protein n=1 Tax=Salinicoccus sesuvii TaxID=868281 RepID=A0ABV7N280_9STAP